MKTIFGITGASTYTSMFNTAVVLIEEDERKHQIKHIVILRIHILNQVVWNRINQIMAYQTQVFLKEHPEYYLEFQLSSFILIRQYRILIGSEDVKILMYYTMSKSEFSSLSTERVSQMSTCSCNSSRFSQLSFCVQGDQK